MVVRNVMLELDEPEEILLRRAAKRLGVPEHAIRNWSIFRRSLDARRKHVRFAYHLEIALQESERESRARAAKVHSSDVAWVEPEDSPEPVAGTRSLPAPPVVVGFGPGGMFAAVRLAEHGYKPIVLERGRPVRQRHRDILQRYYREGDFDPQSNLLYGEGGAGTYSDGKLYTRVNHPLCRYVLETFYRHGADPDILIDSRPHIGSDKLPTICVRIRRYIESLGGEIRFENCVDDIRVSDARLEALHIETGKGGEWLTGGPTIMSIGHSARDTIKMLAKRGVAIEPKPFQIGVRIEHPQAMVDKWQYGSAASHRRLGPAEYHMVAKGAAGELGDVFSFCMCPGGMILPTNESAGLVVTNGASASKRSSGFANSGFVITMNPTAMGMSALDGLDFQQRWEKLAFQATGQTYRVPAQRADDFLAGRRSDGALETSFPLGGGWSDIRSLVPEPAWRALERALPMLDKKFPGLAGREGVITAPETRASAPYRFVRDKETFQAEGVADLYPVGEGAGYAGGIVSAAIDGIRAADRIIETYAPPA